MPTSYTSLLGFALPVTGELQGTWGTTVNDSITELVEDAIAATATASVTSGNWTLSTTGSGSANEARCAILVPTGTPGVSRNIVAPSQSKAYIVINQSNAAVVLKGSATTGTTIAAGDRAVVAWNGSDFVTIASTATDGVSTISFGTTGLTPSTGTSGAVTVAGTLAVANGGTGLSSTPTNGQLDIGNGTGFTRAALTAGSGVSITNGAGSITISATGSGGDVVGPASSTDNAVVRFDGTTGKLVQNSGVLIADDGTTVISVNSATDALRITQTGAGNALLVEDSANPDATPFVVNADGNVGIGVGVTTGYALNVGRTSRHAGFANRNEVIFQRANNTEGSPTVLAADNEIINLSFQGYDGTNYLQAARILAVVDGTPGTNDMPGRLVFSTTADGASAPTERMRIDNAGQVGIGATPSAGVNLQIGKNATGSTSTRGVAVFSTIQSDSTSSFQSFRSSVTTAATAFTLSDLNHFAANQNTLGAGSAVTTQIGFSANSSLTGATNNYGFYSDIASGTGRWNFYANGTAANFFGGVTTFRAANAVRVEAAATQDAVVIAGRAGGTSSYAITLTPEALTGNRTFTLPEPGENVTLGYLNIPQNSQSAAYTLVATDAGKQIFHPSADTTARTYTIPANSSVAYPIGTAITFINQNGAGVVTIAITSDTMRLAGAGTTGNRTLAANGIATCIKVTSTEWIISGTGLT